MTVVGIAEIFGIGEALGIIGTMFVVLYFSRKQMQTLSVDIKQRFSMIRTKEYMELPRLELNGQN